MNIDENTTQVIEKNSIITSLFWDKQIYQMHTNKIYVLSYSRP